MKTVELVNYEAIHIDHLLISECPRNQLHHRHLHRVFILRTRQVVGRHAAFEGGGDLTTTEGLRERLGMLKLGE